MQGRTEVALLLRTALPEIQVDCGRFACGSELFTVSVGACDDATDTVGNSGRATDVILCGHRKGGQLGEVVLVGRTVS